MIPGILQDKNHMFLRQALGEGQVEGHDVEISLNIDGSAVIIRFPATDQTVLYRIYDMVADAYETCFPEEAATKPAVTS